MEINRKFVSMSDDASAVTHNPAGLAQIDGYQIILGTHILFPSTKYEGAFDAETKPVTGYLPCFYFSTDFGKSGPFTLGLGVNVPYGQSMEWEYSTIQNWFYSVPYYSYMQTINISPAVACSINPKLSAGLALNVYPSKLEMDYLLPPATPSKIKVDGTGYGCSFGLLYRADRYSIGLNCKTGFDIDYEGDYSITGYPKEDADARLKFPPVVGLGLALRPNQALKIEFDTEWVGYSCLQEVPVDITGFPPSIEKDWKDSYTFSIGAEYRKSEKTRLMGGIAYITTPIPDSTWDPGLPDADSFVISAGGEFLTKIGSFSMVLGAQLFNDRKSEKGAPYDGKYESKGFFGTVEYKKGF